MRLQIEHSTEVTNAAAYQTPQSVTRSASPHLVDGIRIVVEMQGGIVQNCLSKMIDLWLKVVCAREYVQNYAY
jgi:hypothetical protein